MDFEELAINAAAALRGEPLEWLIARGFTGKTIHDAGLGYIREGRYSNAISIPYYTAGGVVRGMRFRYLGAHRRHKYDNPKGQKIHLYNVVNTNAPKVWVTEGEFDSLILTQMGYPAVGIPGSSGFKTEWKWLFTHPEQVTLVFDSDEAGEKGCQRIASILGEVVDNLYISRLPEGMDVNELYLKDPAYLKELVNG